MSWWWALPTVATVVGALVVVRLADMARIEAASVIDGVTELDRTTRELRRLGEQAPLAAAGVADVAAVVRRPVPVLRSALATRRPWRRLWRRLRSR